MFKEGIDGEGKVLPLHIKDWRVSWGRKEDHKRKVIQELGQIVAHNQEKHKMLSYCD